MSNRRSEAAALGLLSGAAEFRHLAEHQLNGLLHATIGVEIDSPRSGPPQAHRQQDAQFTAPSLLTNGFPRTLPKKIELEFRPSASVS